MLPEASAYVKGYDGQTKQICFLTEDDELLEKHNIVVSLSIIKRF